MNDTLLALVSVAAGFALKAAWSAWIDKQKAIELDTWKLQVSQMEKSLSQFYWPIYIRLQRGNVVWQRIRDRENQSDTERKKLAFQVDEGVLLPNHEEIVKVIESNIHLAALDEEFESQVLAYLRHIDVYRSIRTVGIKDKDPIFFGEPYPHGFFAAVQERLNRYQHEYDQLLRSKGLG